MFARPSRDLLRLPIRPSVAILPASIALVQEPLIVSFELVVQDNAVHSAALLAKPLLCAEVGTVDLRIVRQLARLSETGVERLARMPGTFLSFVPIRLEQVPAAVGQDDRAVVRGEWTRAQQTLLFEVALGLAGVLAAIVEIALRHDPKRADGGEHPAFRAVDLAHAVAFSHRPSLATTRQVEILREYISRVVIVHMIAVAS